MLSSRKSTTIAGVDIETGSIAATEITVNGATRLGKTGIALLPPGVMRDGEVADADALGGLLKHHFAEWKLSRNVRVGMANQRVVVRTIRLPVIEKPSELEAAIRFQAGEQIPMPLEQAVLDWRVVPTDPATAGSGQMDVVLVAARRDVVAGFVSALRVAGLKPVGIDVSSFAMVRALAGLTSRGAAAPVGPAGDDPTLVDHPQGDLADRQATRLYCSLGDVTNLAVARGTTCMFTRISSFGMEGVAQRLAERRGLTLEHARQWLVHVGMSQPVEEIEGDPGHVQASRDALTEGAARLVNELRLSLDFYGSQEGALAVEEIVVCGTGTSITGLPEQLERQLGYPMRVGRPAALAGLDAPAAARLTLPYGLALEE